MKFIKIIFTIFLIVFVPIIISLSVFRQSYISSKTECKSTYIKEYYRRKREIIHSPQWEFPIKYRVESPVNSANVKKAIEIISKNTCIEFEESSSLSSNDIGLIFKEGTSCFSYVGHIETDKPQEIWLTSGCYDNVMIILHEICHALGLIHEHSRRDRDKYIDVYLNNATTNERENFNKQEYSFYKNYSVSYDYHSIMHYHPKDFATDNSKDVIVSKTQEPYNRMMGQQTKMTFNDIKKLNLCYCNTCGWLDTNGDKNKSYSNVNCTNGGYPNYKDCSKCICPSGYTGDDCNNIVSSDESCGNTTFRAKPYVQNLFFDYNKTCYIFLLAEHKKKIDISVFYSHTSFKLMCTEEFGNEIKYRKDKGATGLLLCGWYSNYVNLTSESNSVLIIFRGVTKNNGIFLTFKEHNGKAKRRKTKRKRKN